MVKIDKMISFLIKMEVECKRCRKKIVLLFLKYLLMSVYIITWNFNDNDVSF